MASCPADSLALRGAFDVIEYVPSDPAAPVPATPSPSEAFGARDYTVTLTNNESTTVHGMLKMAATCLTAGVPAPALP